MAERSFVRSSKSCNWIGLSEHKKQEQPSHKEEREYEDTIDHRLLMIEMHEDISHKARFEGRNQETNSHVYRKRAKVDKLGHANGDERERDQR